MNQIVEEIVERCKTKTDNAARKDVCVTKIEEVDDVEHERSVKQRKQEEESEVGERKTTRKHGPRQSSEQEVLERKMTHLPFRSKCRHCIQGREREADCRKASKEERLIPQVHVDYMFMEREKERKTWAFQLARARAT